MIDRTLELMSDAQTNVGNHVTSNLACEQTIQFSDWPK